MKEVTEVSEEYIKDKDKCPNGCLADILLVIKTKDIMFNLQTPWDNELEQESKRNTRNNCGNARNEESAADQ